MSVPPGAPPPPPTKLEPSIGQQAPPCTSTDREMTDQIDPDRDSDSDHSDLPKVPLPVWLVAGASSQGDLPSHRAGHSLISFSGRLYLFGGYCDYASYVAAHPDDADEMVRGARPGIGVHFNSVYEFCQESGEWRVLHAGCHSNDARTMNLPRPRRHASIVVHGASLIVYGGFDVDDTVLADLWEFHIESNTWTQLTCTMNPNVQFPLEGGGSRRTGVPVARAEHTAITYGNRMIIFGGYDGKKKLNDTFVFDFQTKQWSRPFNAEHNSPSRRCKHSAVLYNGKMYVVGGFQYKEGDNYALTDMHALDLDTFVWTAVLMGNGCPEALQGHKAVVCGDSMYVLGGKVRHKDRNSTNAAIAPAMAANSTAMQVTPFMAPHDMSNPDGVSLSNMHQTPATIDVPYQRQSLSMDNRSSGLNNIVYRYIFDANRWVPLETSGQLPAPRQLHAAVGLATGGGRGSIFLFGGTDRAKQRFYNDLWELRGIRIAPDVVPQSCGACSEYTVLLDNPKFSDLTFVVEGQKIYAHRAILYARSEYFRNMFDSKMRETSEPEIEVPNVSLDVFRAVLEYLYSGRVKVSHGRLAVELLKAADMFRIEGLRNVCVEKVEQAVTVENAAFICQVADTHNAQHLKSYCITFMMQNFRDVIKSESFQTLMRQDPGGLGHEILEAYSDNSPYPSGSKRARK